MSALRHALPDHASHADPRGIPLDRVGIKGLQLPITVWDREHRTQHTVAAIDATVALPGDVKGTHMSRFVEVLQSASADLSLRSLPGLCAEVQRRLGARVAQLDVRFPYFMRRVAPVSGAESLLAYAAAFHASRDGESFAFELEVEVPVTTLCPCSKAVSDRGAHNQRGYVRVRLRSAEMVWIEDVVEAVEASASCPLWPLLKREDEKYVTERAYDHPRFVEDLAREVVLRLEGRAAWLRVEVENVESIHAHSAWAVVERGEGGPGAPAAPSAPTASDAEDDRTPAARFGAWLREARAEHGWSQQDLAARVGVSAAQLCKVEAGERSLAPAAVDRLAAALGAPADEVRLRSGIVTGALLAKMQRDPASFLR